MVMLKRAKEEATGKLLLKEREVRALSLRLKVETKKCDCECATNNPKKLKSKQCDLNESDVTLDFSIESTNWHICSVFQLIFIFFFFCYFVFFCIKIILRSHLFAWTKNLFIWKKKYTFLKHRTHEMKLKKQLKQKMYLCIHNSWNSTNTLLLFLFVYLFI